MSALLSSLALACGSAPPPDTEPGAGGAGSSQSSCAGRGEPLVVGLVRATDDVELELVALDPETPVVGDNRWQVRLSRAGEPLENASLSVLPWMPDHEHASTKVVDVSEPAKGRYLLSPVYLGMVGYWEIGVEIAVGDETLGSVSLETCLSRE